MTFTGFEKYDQLVLAEFLNKLSSSQTPVDEAADETEDPDVVAARARRNRLIGRLLNDTHAMISDGRSASSSLDEATYQLEQIHAKCKDRYVTHPSFRVPPHDQRMVARNEQILAISRWADGLAWWLTYQRIALVPHKVRVEACRRVLNACAPGWADHVRYKWCLEGTALFNQIFLLGSDEEEHAARRARAKSRLGVSGLSDCAYTLFLGRHGLYLDEPPLSADKALGRLLWACAKQEIGDRRRRTRLGSLDSPRSWNLDPENVKWLLNSPTADQDQGQVLGILLVVENPGDPENHIISGDTVRMRFGQTEAWHVRSTRPYSVGSNFGWFCALVPAPLPSPPASP